jgi:negative regulator of sigma E activity
MIKEEENQMVKGTVMNVVPESAQGEAGLRPQLIETLSAMMDDEADGLELRRVVKELNAEPQLAATWGRYHAVRASLQQEMHQLPAVNLLAGIRSQLAVEPAVAGKLVNSRSFTGRLLRWAGQGAIAASVAGAVLLSYPLLQTASTQESADASLVAATVVQSQEFLPTLNGDYNASPLTRTVSLDEAARGRLEQAVRNFSGSSAVLDIGSTPMFRSQLEPFAGTPASTDELKQNGQ